MSKKMNKIEKLIVEFCPEGVEYKELGEVVRLEKGKQLNKELLSDVGKYPAYNGGISYSGFTDSYNYNENTIIISQGGASAGFVNFVTTKFYANAHCYVVLPNQKVVENRFVYHFLKLNQEKLTEKQHGAGIPALKTSEILKLKIPIPPLPIQQEIVKILDNFTKLEAELEAELKAELEARKKQYEYYRNKLLTFKPLESQNAD
ncbi:MAG: restriction endonuclease subunit S [Thermoplasmata archaeon]